VSPALATAVLGLVLVLTAATFDAEPLYVPGIAFAGLALGAIAWVALGSRGLRVARTVGARTVEEEQVVAIQVEIRAGTAVLPTGVVDDPLLPTPAPLAAGRRRTRLRIHATFSRRGIKLLQAPAIVVRDPFGLATRTVTAGEDAELLVLPRVVPLGPPGDGAGGEALGLRRGRPHAAAEVELDGLRPLRPGAPASRIFWPALARSGELVERRLLADTDTRPLVVLDPRPPAAGVTAAFEEDLDAAVRAVASLCVHLARAGGCALLLPGDRRPLDLDATLAAWPRAHVRLALVEGGAAPVAAGMADRRGPVLYVSAVTGRRPPPALLRASAPGASRLLVVPGTLPGRVASFAVAGCTAYALRDARARVGAA
jgi:uncharacterized protein (DUF58 family)